MIFTIKKITRYFLIFFLVLVMLFLLSEPGFFILEKTRNIDPGAPGEGVVVYFINLDSSTKRKNHILPSIKKIGYPYERISAVDGRQLSQEELDRVSDAEFHHSVSDRQVLPGNIACSLSHFKTWETFLRSNYKYAVVFEDDALFEPSELDELIRNLDVKSDKTDIKFFYRLNPTAKTLRIRDLGKYKEVLFLRKFASTASYMLNRKAAASLLGYAYPIKEEVDMYMNRSWEFGLKDTMIKPLPVQHNWSMGSERGERLNYETSYKPGNSSIVKARRAIFQFKTKAIRIVYQYIVFLKIKLGTS